MTDLSEYDIQRVLWYWLGSIRSLAITNAYLYGGNESDFLTVTKANYVDEYEIKLTRSDFHKDKLKLRAAQYESLSPWEHYPSFTFHKGGERVDFHSIYHGKKYPNRFHYVTPEGLITSDEVPKYAGLIYIINGEALRTVKKPEKLVSYHQQWIVQKILRLTHSRYWILKNRGDISCQD